MLFFSFFSQDVDGDKEEALNKLYADKFFADLNGDIVTSKEGKSNLLF